MMDSAMANLSRGKAGSALNPHDILGAAGDEEENPSGHEFHRGRWSARHAGGVEPLGQRA